MFWYNTDTVKKKGEIKMIISTTKKIELTDRENMVLRKAAEIIATLSEILDDGYYDNLTNRIEGVYLHEPWEVDIEDEDTAIDLAYENFHYTMCQSIARTYYYDYCEVEKIEEDE